MKENVIVDKSIDFAVDVVRLYQYLCKEKKEFILSKQLLASGAGIGANIKKSIRGQTRKDFNAKMCIALK